MRHLCYLLLFAALATLVGCMGSDPPANQAGASDPTQPGLSPPEAPARGDGLRAGVAVIDMTPDVGYCAGQYCDNTDIFEGLSGGAIDPYLHATLKKTSTGVQSRLTARALVVEDADGRRIALLKTDNYLAQDLLLRRVGQILDQGDSGIGYAQILHTASHAHSTAYSSTLAAGVFIFQDVFDARFFEHQAQRIAEAIDTAAGALRPAAMGATTVEHRIFKGNVTRLATADDGSPAGYPLEYGDPDVTVLRFDDVSDPAAPEPLAIWVNFGQHPEGLDGYDLHSADFLAPLERFVDRETGAILLFSQGDVGSAEASGNRCQLLDGRGNVIDDTTESLGGDGRGNCAHDSVLPDTGVWRDWFHEGYAQAERGARYLADAIIDGWEAIGNGEAIVPMRGDHPVDFRLAWVPGPVSHPYPSVSNCRTDPTLEGYIGLPATGLPDCQRLEETSFIAPAVAPLAMLAETLRAHGLPVPSHYDVPAFGVVEENLRLMLQTFRIGEVLLASCACEAQVDLILNLKSRLDREPANTYNGFDWACLIDTHRDDPAYAEACALQETIFDSGRFQTPVPGDAPFDEASIARMRAQVHNDAAGWDDPENALAATSEPVDPEAIWGNFTHETIQDLGVEGYTLPVGIGHAGDNNGYTVSYREYMNRDHYRKALTSYGPHTADYAVTRLVRMAAAMRGGEPLSPEALAVVGTADELRQIVTAEIVGHGGANAVAAYQQLLADNIGPAEALEQPADIERFNAATFRWRGGANAVDNPVATVERLRADGQWETFADASGEVQTRVEFPEGVTGVLQALGGLHEWQWEANFEAFSAYPRRLGSTPPGDYRFRVRGHIRQDGDNQAYELISEPFRVAVWSGIEAENVVLDAEGVAFSVPAIRYPASYESDFAFIDDGEAERHICRRCSFRPWARRGSLEEAWIEVERADGTNERVAANGGNGRFQAAVALNAGDQLRIHLRDDDGNRNTPEVLQIAE